MTTYGNLRTANEDKIEIKHGSVGSEFNPTGAKSELQHRTHQLGGEIAKPTGTLELRTRKLGGEPGEGAITDCYGTTPMKNRKATGR